MKSSKPFIAELHDIGKLIDRQAFQNSGINISGHTFHDFNFSKIHFPQPSSSSWWGQYHHEIEYDKEIKDWRDIPSDFKQNLFLLILADHLASSVSRATADLAKITPAHEGIVKLWNKNYYKNQEKRGKLWAAFRSIDDLKILFSEIENCQSGEDFLSRYKEHLLLTPEDKTAPRNITSLYTHIELTGKIYRILEKKSKVVTEPDGSLLVEYEEEKVKTIREAEGGRRTIGMNDVDKGKWQARLIKCWIKFPHSFVRLDDVNLLRKREEMVNYISGYCKDEVIFATSDFITLFLPLNQNLKEMLKPLLDYGFHLEIEETLADLGILNSILDRKTLKARKSNDQERLKVLNSRATKIYKRYLLPEIPDKLKPPICDICQQNIGVEKIKGSIREWICEKCQEIRDIGEPFREYGTVWEEEGVKVCWFKFSLDQSKVETWLQNAFGEYIGNYNFKHTDMLKEEFRPLALQVEFNNDYKEMLKDFWNKFKKYQDIKKPVAYYDELGVFKYSPELIKLVIESYINLFEQYFQDCTGEEALISLSLNITNIKYPIREHWKFFEEDKKNFLNIRYHKVFDEKYSKDELKDIIVKAINKEVASTFLHNLVQLEEKLKSNIHIFIEVFENRRKYPEICELVSRGINPSKILSLYRVFREG